MLQDKTRHSHFPSCIFPAGKLTDDVEEGKIGPYRCRAGSNRRSMTARKKKGDESVTVANNGLRRWRRSERAATEFSDKTQSREDSNISFEASDHITCVTHAVTHILRNYKIVLLFFENVCPRRANNVNLKYFTS